jgi:15-cis-phytoene synthase
VTLNALPPLALQSGDYIGRPLPAEEQLAPLLRLIEHQPAAGSSDEEPPSPRLLAEAYHTCQRIIRQHSKSFFFSTQFLPPDKRMAVRALYAFCRTSDNTVDEASADPARALASWVQQVRARRPDPSNPVLVAWHDTRIRYGLSPQLQDELLAGMAMDLTITRYDTFADLWLYCYRAASVVGLLSMGITGSAPGARPYAIKLGVALQLTNILRDIGEDGQRGRVYLPQDELARFGLTPDDILNRVYDERFVDFMRFQVERNHRLYDEAWPGIALLPEDSRFGVAAAAVVYRGILDSIVANNYDSYRQRAYVPTRQKLALLPRIWFDIRKF